MRLEDKLFLDKYRVDSESHLKIKDPEVCLQCADKQCTLVCPVGVYKWDEGQKKIVVGWENCIEMGACTVACNEFNNIDMIYPRGGYGISYKYG
ncbi:MAG: ferredoxin family protein [Nitrospiria bacterium]